jgi:hypothetical protein
MTGPLVGPCHMKGNTSFAPLAALGYSLRERDVVAPIRQEVKLGMRTVEHEPHEKLIDCLVSSLAGCRSVGQVNLRLRPAAASAAAWGRRQVAEQSTLWATLDACTGEHVAQLRAALTTTYRREAQALRHLASPQGLTGDLDLSGLPASPWAEGSTKGYFSGKKIKLAANWLGRVVQHWVRRCVRCCLRASSCP